MQSTDVVGRDNSQSAFFASLSEVLSQKSLGIAPIGKGLRLLICRTMQSPGNHTQAWKHAGDGDLCVRQPQQTL